MNTRDEIAEAVECLCSDGSRDDLCCPTLQGDLHDAAWEFWGDVEPTLEQADDYPLGRVFYHYVATRVGAGVGFFDGDYTDGDAAKLKARAEVDGRLETYTRRGRICQYGGGQ